MDTPPPDPRRSSPAVARNRDAILAVLATALPSSGLVLEVASGSGEHALHFARALPALDWQPSDPSAEARRSIAAWIAADPLRNIRAPLDLDAESGLDGITEADAMLCINMVHISPWAATEGLLHGARRMLRPGAPLCLYGPFRQANRPLAASNLAFDTDLKQRDSRWGLRQVEDVDACAQAERLVLDRSMEMPANNLMLIFRRRSD